MSLLQRIQKQIAPSCTDPVLIIQSRGTQLPLFSRCCWIRPNGEVTISPQETKIIAVTATHNRPVDSHLKRSTLLGPERIILTHRQATFVAKHNSERRGFVLNVSTSQLYRHA
ncbi:hypothetical protein CHS0354_016506 [Potamilus streckersoni]|uniref:Uncharacterized protein n=1 Tax=Potamilus streckersoni TaxID=2493646 RepID=A0AAE0SJQ6_9BIVA|nr:hypothetical protein CHS0354_016506 [Potamilus streckersoni]